MLDLSIACLTTHLRAAANAASLLKTQGASCGRLEANLKQQTLEPFALAFPEATRFSGLGRTKLYDLIAANEIEAVKIGARRLILTESLKKLLTAGAVKQQG